MKVLGLNIRRLNRLSYFLTIAISMFIFVAIGLFFSYLITQLTGNNPNPSGPNPFGLVPLMILWYVYFCFCSAQRFHDVEMSGWWNIGLFIPYVNVILLAILLFKKGFAEDNKFGKPTDKVLTMGFKIVG